MGGDGDIPIDIVVDNIKITKKGYLERKNKQDKFDLGSLF